MSDDPLVEDKQTLSEKVEEEMNYEADESLASFENSFITSGPEAAERAKSDDTTDALDISDSELLCQKQKKRHVLDALDDLDSVDETEAGDDLPPTSTPGTTTPVSQPVGAATELDANSFKRVVQSFPLPAGQHNRPVVGPPSLDQEMLRKMEQLQLQIPVSLPQEDVERVARLELLKQRSCGVDNNAGK